jgi:hypothetical protein
MDLTADIDNLLANSAGIISSSTKHIRDVVEKLAAVRDNLETIAEYRTQRAL